MLLLQDLASVVLIGIGATALMDAWLLAQARLGLPASSFALIGRWVGHWPRGRFAHAAIAKAAPIPAELALGWLTHYAVGIAYACVWACWASAGCGSPRCFRPWCSAWPPSRPRCS
jgi:hypothetical protein